MCTKWKLLCICILLNICQEAAHWLCVLTVVFVYFCIGELLHYNMKRTWFALQTDEEWDDDELARGEQGVSISQLLEESDYKGLWFASDTQNVLVLC